MNDSDRIEELLAEAIAAFDDGGDPALRAFVGQHPQERTRLLRGIERCREMGLLGKNTPARDFPERLGEFQLLRRIGGGGMGVVYEAEQTSLGRRVALKVIRPELLFFEGARERFRREIEAVARLSHPAVVPVLASGEQDGVPYYVMELLTGRTVADITVSLAGRNPADMHGAQLRELLRPSAGEATDPFAGPWWTTCVRLIHAVALGVRHAHLRGIVHRDIKPSNVMITPHGQAVLLDFGVASIQGGREFTKSGQTPGSPAFMSPEQLRGAAVDERTDVYSLGATLWQLLALHAPFKGVDDLQKIRDGEVPRLRARNRAVPSELAIVVHKAMDRDRERRYADMEAFAQDLQAVLQRRPIAGRRLGPGLRLLRWCQRHRVTATALGGLLVSAAALPAVLAWQTQRTNMELEAAQALTKTSLDKAKQALADEAAAKQLADERLVQAKQALADEAAAKQLADESLEQAMLALDSVLIRLGHERLRYVPAAEQLTIEALQDAVAAYRRLLPSYPDRGELARRAARALGSLASALARTGKTDDAVARYREAIALLRPDDMRIAPLLIDGRAYAEMNLGNLLLHRGDRDEAQKLLDAAERDFRAVGDRDDCRKSSLRGRSELATLRVGLEPTVDRAREEVALRESLDLQRQQLALARDDLEAQASLVTRLDNLATNLSAQKRRDEAAVLLDEALTCARALPADARVWPSPPLLVASVLETQGLMWTDMKEKRAIAALEECLRLRESVAAEFPANVELRTLVGGAQANLGRLDYYLGRDEQAVAGFDRAIATLRDVLAIDARRADTRQFLATALSLRGNALIQLKRHAEIAANAEQIARQETTDGLRTAARHLLRTAELLAAESPPPDDAATVRDRYLHRALDLLVDAERRGWGRTSRLDDPVYKVLDAFPEFAALRDRVAARLRNAPAEK